MTSSTRNPSPHGQPNPKPFAGQPRCADPRPARSSVLRPSSSSFTIFGGSNFASATGAASWLNVAASLGIVAIPIGLLMIAGELDISIGSMIPAGSDDHRDHIRPFSCADSRRDLARARSRRLVGFINGLLVIRTAVPSFIVTLATLFAVAGLTLGLSRHPDRNHQRRDQGRARGQVSAGAIHWRRVSGDHLLVDRRMAIVFGFILHYSPYGNWILAMGGDKVSARNAGIPTRAHDDRCFSCAAA